MLCNTKGAEAHLVSAEQTVLAVSPVHVVVTTVALSRGLDGNVHSDLLNGNLVGDASASES